MAVEKKERTAKGMLARLMREAGDAINEYDRNLENHK